MNKRISKKKAHILYNNERKFMYLFKHRLIAYDEEIANKYMGLYLKKNYRAKTYTSDEVRIICDYIRSAVYKAALTIDMNKALNEVSSNEV
jgi:hypothetical protein